MHQKLYKICGWTRVKTSVKSPRSNSEAVRFLHCFYHNLCVFCTSCVPFLVILETIIGHSYPKLTIFGHNLYHFWVPKVSCVPFLVILETIIGHYWLLKPSENEVEVTAQRELSDVVFHLLSFVDGYAIWWRHVSRRCSETISDLLGRGFGARNLKSSR